MPAPEIIQQLVARFEEHREAYRLSKYNEAQLRREFLDPFLEALGWDVFNRQGYAETYKEVVHEDSLEVEGAMKAPDYAFRVGGQRKFFVEAKKPSVNIQSDIYPAFQLRRYSWSAKLPLGVLSDFEEFAIYDCRSKPDKKDKATTGRVAYYSYREYVEKWDEIASIFSREAVLKGSFDSYAEGVRGKKGTTEVDDAFLTEIEHWRDVLARNFAIRNESLTTRELNYAVQMTIDRIIFLRICEDRGIERYGKLQELLNTTPTALPKEHRDDVSGTSPKSAGEKTLQQNSSADLGEAGRGSIYEGLCQIFQQADARYNSGLFHFKDEKEASSAADSLTLGLSVDDKVLREILGSLYYPESPYVFSEIPSDILGQVYERFLGKVIRLTAGHQAKVEEKPEVRKAGGVYYTPTYIVEYIVKNTVGKLLEGKTPRDVSALRILDPACGSGTFPLGAFQYLLDWHLKWYIENDPEKWAKGKNPAIFESTRSTPTALAGTSPKSAGEKTLNPKDGADLGEAGRGWMLTTAEKKRILLNNIYGVDIDPQAVEVTKLSLLLKVLENESEQTIGSQLSLIQERALPDLGKNIKCGNSLIGPEYYEGHQLTMSFADEEERYRVNAFDWKAGFSQVFIQGGFDAVIGNPPYVRIQTLNEWASQEVNFYNNKYKSSGKGNYDLYGLFIEKGLGLIKDSGFLSYIIGSKWFQTSYAENLRKMVGTNLVRILDFKHNQVFENAFVNTCVLLLSKKQPDYVEYISVDKGSDLEVTVAELIEGNNPENINSTKIESKSFTSDAWHFGNSGSRTLIEKIKSNKPTLEEVTSRIYQGLKTSGDKIFLVQVISREKNKLRIYSNQLQKELDIEPDLLKNLYRGSQVKRFNFIEEDRGIIFPYRERELILEKEMEKTYPLTYQYFLENRQTLEAREHGNLKGKNWYAYGRSQALEVVGLPKIITPDLARFASFAWDDSGKAYFVGGAAGGYGIILKPEWDYKYLLGLLNSKLINFYITSQTTQMESGFYSFEARFIRSTPIAPVNFSNPKDKAHHDKMVSLVERMLELHKQSAVVRSPLDKERVAREIESTDKSIDRLVYELYGLTEDEIKIVEGR